MAGPRRQRDGGSFAEDEQEAHSWKKGEGIQAMLYHTCTSISLKMLSIKMCFLARWQVGKTAEYAPSSNPQAREQVLCASWASGPHHGRLWVPLGPRLLTDFSLTRKRFLLFAENILCLVILICFRTSTSGYSLSVIEMIFAAIFVVYMCDLHTKIQIINQPWSDFF